MGALGGTGIYSGVTPVTRGFDSLDILRLTYFLLRTSSAQVQELGLP
jgi:hypothetical protein